MKYCTHCGSSNVNYLENVEWECFDCGETFYTDNSTKGFTLIECMVVLAIIGILASISIPGISAIIKVQKRIDASIAVGQGLVTQLQDTDLIRVCVVDDNCTGNALLCIQSNRLRTCTAAQPCLFVDGLWKHNTKTCSEGVLSLKN